MSLGQGVRYARTPFFIVRIPYQTIALQRGGMIIYFLAISYLL